ncbi:hypothetical protein GW17_00037025 [Ensete ventricosum]|nr:hypothetical protein GW17_00037025 [Ensete ventricosum]
MVDFWWNRPVAGGPRTGNLADRYVPPVIIGSFLIHSGRVLLMLGKAQFELQKLVDSYVSPVPCTYHPDHNNPIRVSSQGASNCRGLHCCTYLLLFESKW